MIRIIRIEKNAWKIGESNNALKTCTTIAKITATAMKPPKR